MQNKPFVHSDVEEYDEPVLSKAVKAGRRTYFIDVRATRGGDHFLTITESRKFSKPDGTMSFERHKVFLYKEDFGKFYEALNEAVDFVKQSQADYFASKE